jgi:hypothetical protein
MPKTLQYSTRTKNKTHKASTTKHKGGKKRKEDGSYLYTLPQNSHYEALAQAAKASLSV